MTLHLTYRDPITGKEEKTETAGFVSRVTVRNFSPNDVCAEEPVLIIGTKPNHRVVLFSQIQCFWVEED